MAFESIDEIHQTNKIFCPKTGSAACNHNKRVRRRRIGPFYGNSDELVVFIMKIDAFIAPATPIPQQTEFFVIEWMKRVGNAHLLWQLGHKRCSSVDLPFHANEDIFAPPVTRSGWWNSGNGCVKKS